MGICEKFIFFKCLGKNEIISWKIDAIIIYIDKKIWPTLRHFKMFDSLKLNTY